MFRGNFSISQFVGSRANQEDSFGFVSGGLARRPRVVVVADGMGGHSGGEVASQLAVSTLLVALHRDRRGVVGDRLRAAVLAANKSIVEKARARPELAGMGSTIVAAACRRRKLHWISVGDSPLWLFRKGALLRLNADHSMRGLLEKRIREGELDPATIDPQAYANTLYSYLGDEQIALIDCPEEPRTLRYGDWVILASDGIETLSPAEIEVLLVQTRTVGGACRSLSDAVKASGNPKQDNATLAIWCPLPPADLALLAALLAVLIAALAACAIYLMPGLIGEAEPAPRSRRQAVPAEAPAGAVEAKAAGAATPRCAGPSGAGDTPARSTGAQCMGDQAQRSAR